MSKKCVPFYIILQLLITLVIAQGDRELDKLLLEKVDPFLSRMISDPSCCNSRRGGTADEYDRIHLITQVRDAETKRFVRKLGHINTDLGSLITVDLPFEKVNELLALEGLLRVEYGGLSGPRNDKAKVHIGVDKVHDGQELISSGYRGKGVIVGIIDDGIDVMHPDFRDGEDSTKSRILYLWNQAGKVNRPSGFSYGTLYTKSDIETAITNGQPNEIIGENYNSYAGVGHGTLVSGSAAGLRGIAPEASLIVVSLRQYSVAKEVDAAQFIIQKAAELNMPCIINFSIGGVAYAGDGQEMFTQMFNELVRIEGRVGICASAGNSGYPGSYWSADLDNDTVYNGQLGFGRFGVNFYLEDRPADSLYLKLYIDSVSIDFNGFVLSEYQYVKTSDTIEAISFEELWSGGSYRKTGFRSNGEMAGMIRISPSRFKSLKSGQSYRSFYLDFDDLVDINDFEAEKNKIDFLRIEISGKGRFEARFEGFPPTLMDPVGKGFEEKHFLTTQNRNNVDIPAIAENILAVGAYTNRDFIIDVNGDTVHAKGPEGDLAFFSSAGPTADGRIKPEIVAPGELVRTSMSSRYLKEPGAGAKAFGANPQIGDVSGVDVVSSGTSLSAPMVTGTVALMWQANPDLTFGQIRDIIINTAAKDEFTEAKQPTPNPEWGYGKINALEAVKESERILEVTSLNDFKDLEINVYPNPTESKLIIDLEHSDHVVYSLFLTDMDGKTLDYQHFENRSSRIIYDTNKLSNGVYVLSLITDSGKVAGKILKL